VIRCTILGTGTSIRRPDGRAPAGYLVEGGGASILVDPGPGAMHRAVAQGLDLAAFDAVAATHLHLDHISDLGMLFFTLRAPQVQRTKRLLVLGGPGIDGYVSRLRKLHGVWAEPRGYGRAVQEGARWRVEVGTLGVQAGPVDHIPGAVGLRFMSADGSTLVYSGDTTGCDDLITLAKGADVLIMACSAPDDAPMAKHATPSAVARVAAAAQVRRVILTHFYPDIDPAAAAAQVAGATGIPCEAAGDGFVVEAQAPPRDDPSFRVV
jgi:ribonuclease BN (tRNA processing enzyme)